MLHERDIAANEITTLLLCMDQANPAVSGVASLVGEWVAKSHGASAVARERHDCGLFIALTKLDLAFAGADSGAPERRIDWDARIVATFHGAFAQYGDWPQQWTPGRPFDNLHLVSSPTYKSALFDAASERSAATLKPAVGDRVQRARTAFLEIDAVRRHMTDPAGVWDDAFASGDGGILRLSKSIVAVCHAQAKFRQLFADAEQLRATVKNSLIRYFPGEHSSIPFDHRRAVALTVTRRLRSTAEARRFNALFAALSVADTELVEVFRDLDARLSPTAANDDLLLARAALDSWVTRIRSFARSGQLETNFHAPAATVQALVDELVIGANRTRLEARIAERIRSAAGITTEASIRGEIAAICAARLINNFLFYLGFDNPRGNAQLRRKDRADTPIFTRSETADLSRAAEDTTNAELGLHADWAQAFLMPLRITK